MTLEQKNRLEQAVKKLLKEDKVRDVYLFGSCARGDEREDSDLDLLIFLDIDYDDKNILKIRNYIRHLSNICRPNTYSRIHLDFSFLFRDKKFDDLKNMDFFYNKIYNEAIHLNYMGE